jgi:hypothetical protein
MHQSLESGRLERISLMKMLLLAILNAWLSDERSAIMHCSTRMFRHYIICFGIPGI